MKKMNNLNLLLGLSDSVVWSYRDLKYETKLASDDISVSIMDMFNDGSCRVVIKSKKASTTIEASGNLNDDSFIDRLRGAVILLSSDSTIWE